MNNKIPGLSDLAKRLKDISFPDEFSLCGMAVEKRAANGDIHNCHPAGSHNVAVRFYLGGAQRVLGFTDNACDAARFADMARVRFQQYRQRGGTEELTDRDMNLDLHQVYMDTESVPQAVALLDDIEHLLLATGAIKTRKQRIQEFMETFRNQPPRVRVRQTQKAELLATLKEINDRLARMELRLNALQPREMGGSMPPMHEPGVCGNVRLSGCEGD